MVPLWPMETPGSGADHGQARRVETDDVAQRWHAVLAVRIVGEDRTSGRGARWRHHPVVGTDGVALLIGFSQECIGIMRHGGLLPGGRKGHRPCRQIIGRQHILRDAARVQPLGNLRRPLRLELDPQPVRVQPRGAGDQRPLDLGGDVPGQSMAANADHILRGPQLRHRACDLEFHRPRALAGPHIGNIGVDAGDERLGIGPGFRPIGRPLRGHVAAIEEQSQRLVLLDIGRAEVLGEQSQSALAPEIDLPEPVACRVEALEKKQIVLVAGIDVGNAPDVDEDLARRLQSGHAAARQAGRGRHPVLLALLVTRRSIGHRDRGEDRTQQQPLDCFSRSGFPGNCLPWRRLRCASVHFAPLFLLSPCRTMHTATTKAILVASSHDRERSTRCLFLMQSSLPTRSIKQLFRARWRRCELQLSLVSQPQSLFSLPQSEATTEERLRICLMHARGRLGCAAAIELMSSTTSLHGTV